MAKMKLITRRKFLITGSLVGGGLAVAYALGGDGAANKEPFAQTGADGDYTLNAWVKINTDNSIRVAISQAEMGQGILTGLCMLVAEELGVSVDKITPEQAPVSSVYGNFTVIQDSLPFSDGHHLGEKTAGAWAMKKVGKLLGVQVTGGSTSVRNFWEPMQQAGAAAREMLKQAAAARWSISPNKCDVRDGDVIDTTSSRSLSFGELAAEAAALKIPEDIKLKPAGVRKVIGTSPQRLDIPAKITGQAKFGVDTILPDMAFAAVRLCPYFGGSIKSINPASIEGMPGILTKPVMLENGVAVIADCFWRAKRAVEELEIEFEKPASGTISTNDIFDQFAQQISEDDGRTYAEDGDAKATLLKNGDVFTAIYKAPFLAHATMEPMNCTAFVTDDSVEVWAPTQVPTLAAWFAEKIADVPGENVKIHNPLLGGGFGRRLEVDYIIMGITIAKALNGRPVKMIWTRENDMQHDMYRPAALAQFSGCLTNDGRIEAWHNQVASPSITRDYVHRLLPWASADMPDNTTSEGAADLPYQFITKLVEHYPGPTPIPIGYWRSVGHSYNGFFTECFMDELANKAGIDPVEFRLRHLAGHEDFHQVLTSLASVSNWAAPLPEGHGRGVALHESFGTIVGQVVEVSVSEYKEITIQKVTCVVDCGEVLYPDGVISQMEGAIIYGLTAALFGEITIEDNKVVQENFPDYEMLTMAACPEIDVHLAPSGRPLGGAGEPGTPPIAPALVNAIFNATGERIRELPLSKHGFFV
ncbi:xanthine dehydrogenase family protein molybdopterin-binding subunit [Sneathiella limimaris]|uniref:xanthine dehydrogenase family protein molybdopterin-binding subunit n=1 Tax=Sneathiella limimaris TaxID=1964213 RepID=UPI00146D28C4|nr:molybdopterin cofactor-binding domain-containing protein [Sneathiella limimaris]